MQTYTFDIERAPQFGIENPGIYSDAFPSLVLEEPLLPDDLLDPRKVLLQAKTATQNALPHYGISQAAVEDCHASGVASCIGRSAYFASLIAPFTSIKTGITVIFSEYAQGVHVINTASAVDDDYDAVIDNWSEKKNKDGKSPGKLGIFDKSYSSTRGVYGGNQNIMYRLKQLRDPSRYPDVNCWLFMRDEGNERLEDESAEEFMEFDPERSYKDRVGAYLLFDSDAVNLINSISLSTRQLVDRDFRHFLSDLFNGSAFGLDKETTERALERV